MAVYQCFFFKEGSFSDTDWHGFSFSSDDSEDLVIRQCILEFRRFLASDKVDVGLLYRCYPDSSRRSIIHCFGLLDLARVIVRDEDQA